MVGRTYKFTPKTPILGQMVEFLVEPKITSFRFTNMPRRSFIYSFWIERFMGDVRRYGLLVK